MRMGNVVGTVIEINRFPVKSMAGERMACADIDWQGIEGDRQYAFYLADHPGRFPWLTGRDLSRLVTWSARYRDPAAPRTSPVDVSIPGESALALNDPALAARLGKEVGRPIGLLQLGRGAYDAMPVSVITTASLAELERVHGTPLDRRRFRINIVVESERSEREWRGRRLFFGGGEEAAALLIAAAIDRCVMITIDPDSADRDPRVMRTVAQEFGNEVGVFASPARPGPVRVGDAVAIED
jgi:uncharacterized protein YcbX